MTNLFENQFLGMLNHTLTNGLEKIDRTKVGTRSVFGYSIETDLEAGFPMITTRKIAFRLSFEEIMWMLRGQCDANILKDKNIHIWDGNTTREFLDNRGLNYLPEGHIGKGYGFQWRNFGGDYKSSRTWWKFFKKEYDYYYLDGKGVDQIQNLLNSLKNDPNGRRHIVMTWNPQQEKEMALPPCHLYHQYAVNDGKLDSFFLMRSVDEGFGLPYNFMGYAFLNHAFSKVLGLKPGKLRFEGIDAHIYNNQVDMVKEQITREPYAMPQLHIKKDLKSLDDILSLEYSDIEIVGYKAHADFKDKPKMAV
jgi:thymidylate synthase